MADIITAIPWLVLLLVFVGMAALQWRSQAEAAELAKMLAQLLGQKNAAAVPAPVHLDLKPVELPAKPPVALPAPPKPPEPSRSSLPWYLWAQQQIGFHETGNNQGIERYIGLAHCGALGDPWCAIFTNAALESSGIPGTRSASSQSFRHHPDFVQLPGPALGAIVVFWRGSPDSGLGHVGFYRGEDADRIWTLGGNENDMVQIEALPKSSAGFGLIGYWWPKSVPQPAVGPVLMPPGSPAHVQSPPAAKDAQNITENITPGVQTNITATMFGGQKSAYGGPIDDSSPGCALPFRFEGERPKVKATNPKTGQTCVMDIVDVGPWNTHDPYWQTGSRPQAESGTDMMTPPRHTNRAGIDLTLAAAKALGIDGKGLLNWEFATSPLSEPSTPKVT